MTVESKHLYRAVKWLWLLLQATILPLAAWHAVSVRVNWPLSLPAPLLFFTGAAFLVTWLIAQSLLAMARFPLTVKGAFALTAATVAQMVFLISADGTLAGSAYGAFFAALAALVAVTVILAVAAMHRAGGRFAAGLLLFLLLLPAAGTVWFMMAPLEAVFSGMPPWQRSFAWLAVIANSGLIIFNLYRFSIFAPLMEDDAAYALEWERWAAPTIVILILSAAAAIVLVGISSR